MYIICLHIFRIKYIHTTFQKFGVSNFSLSLMHTKTAFSKYINIVK